MRRMSLKRQRGRAAWAKVYREVDRRSGGQCEVILHGPFSARCPRRATEHHHTVKPRASHNTPELVIHLCQRCHQRSDWPFTNGRLVITPLRFGGFHSEVIWAIDKRVALRLEVRR